MVCARLHIICGNCGCNDMFEYSIDPKGHDFGDRFEPSVRLHCRNCATLHALEDNAKGIAQTAPQPEQSGLVAVAEINREYIGNLRLTKRTAFESMPDGTKLYALSATPSPAKRGDA